MSKMFLSKILPLASAAFLLSTLFAGCGRFSYGPPPEVQITIDYPGADPVAVEDKVCTPIFQQLMGIEGDAKITCVSRAGQADIYVQAKRHIDPDIFFILVMNRTSLAKPVLPDKIKISGVQKVSSPTIPSEAEIKEVDSLDVDVDRDKARQLGLSVEDVIKDLDNKMAGDADSKSAEGSPSVENDMSQKEELAKKWIFKTPEGKEYSLAEFATIKTIRKPNMRILRDTPKPGGK
jgi:multidrug efflux pump subunit AcrB